MFSGLQSEKIWANASGRTAKMIAAIPARKATMTGHRAAMHRIMGRKTSSKEKESRWEERLKASYRWHRSEFPKAISAEPPSGGRIPGNSLAPGASPVKAAAHPCVLLPMRTCHHAENQAKGDIASNESFMLWR